MKNIIIFNILLSLISSCRLASPNAENRSSLIRVSALKLCSKWAFLSFNVDNADITKSILSWLCLYGWSSYDKFSNFRSPDTTHVVILKLTLTSFWAATYCSSFILSSLRNALASLSNSLRLTLQLSVHSGLKFN